MPLARELIAASAAALKERMDEVNRLNVFPVPDGDTGTNMSLTMTAVVAEIDKLGPDATVAQVCHAVTYGSLMGARGNSGVILSQILRGLCEGIGEGEVLDTEVLAQAFERSTEVAFQAVRKPVEGTMLTVLRETGVEARAQADADVPLNDALRSLTAAAFESVRRTPDLLPVLKENGVVDAGGFGLALLVQGFVSAALGEAVATTEIATVTAPLEVVPVDDWDDDEYLYCTEFLLFGDDIDREAVHDYVAEVGGSELVVGDAGQFKVHVHTNEPGTVLGYMTGIGEVAEVHINNMRRQQAVRDEHLHEEIDRGPAKPVGFVAVAAGEGMAQILRSLGVDQIVSGGQTMNPSTSDLLEAVDRVNADAIVILPNNKNIQMAATAAASVAKVPVAVVPTRSVPQAFSALLAVEPDASLDEIAAAMTEAAGAVHTGEVTTAVKNAVGKTGAIKAGQVIGIIDDEDIEAVGEEVIPVAVELTRILAKGADTLTILAGAEFDDASVATLEQRLASEFPDLEIETLRGDQPLYPVILSAE